MLPEVSKSTGTPPRSTPESATAKVSIYELGEVLEVVEVVEGDVCEVLGEFVPSECTI